MSHSPATTLDRLKKGRTCVIRRLGGDRHFISRTAAMGFAPGAFAVMIQNRRLFPLIVFLKDTVIALDRNEAKRIEIDACI